MTRSDIGQRVALLLFEAGAIHISRQQPFILAAGWASPVYVDCRILIGKPETRHAITELSAAYLASVFPAKSFDAIAGAETAGIPFATLLAEHSGLELRYVRKRPLGIGRNAQVEGGSVEGSARSPDGRPDHRRRKQARFRPRTAIGRRHSRTRADDFLPQRLFRRIRASDTGKRAA